MNYREYLTKNRETAQLVYGVALIILIPSLIVFNTVFIIKKYNQNLDMALQRQALSVGRSISTLMENDFPWIDFIQIKIDALMAGNAEIQKLDVLKLSGNDFEVIASSDQKNIGKVMNSYYYKTAWMQPGSSGLATDSLKLTSAMNEPAAENGETESAGDGRFWLVAMPMFDSDGVKQALLTVKLSSKIVDDMTRENRNMAIFLLIGTVFIAIMFLFVAVRMWDYVLLYRKIKAVDQMKDEFISMASHELRSPVAGISGYVSMIRDETLGPVSQKVKDCLQTVQIATDRLTVLVEDLLDVSRIEQGRIKMNIRPQSVIPLIEEAINELRPQAAAKKIDLNFTPASRGLAINIDANYFKQIIINLLSNAIKYTEKGSVEIAAEERYDGRTLEIRVKDTGIGMTLEERARLFEKFYRVKNEKTLRITGTGLGLWITKQLVELMKGSIAIDSIEGVGTQATLQFAIIKKS